MGDSFIDSGSDDRRLAIFSLGLDESSTLIIGIILFGIAWSLTLNKDKNEYTTILAGLFFLIANSF